jgi:hypothetical protein
MRVQSSTRYVALAALVGALACAGNKVRTEEAAAARDTTSTRDTLGGEAQNPPGYRGMERDTAIAQPHEQTPTDTFLQRQGQGAPQDTAGYSGIERVDTTGGAAGAGHDTTGMTGMDSTVTSDSTGAIAPTGLDSTGMSETGDTTGYSPSQQSRDTTYR